MKITKKPENIDLTINSVASDSFVDKFNQSSVRKTPIRRFLLKVEKTESCWIWIAARNQFGYGMFRVETGKVRGAHRWSFEQFKGPIPAGHDVCHSCDVRNCVNPDHLWVALPEENLRDMSAKGRHNSMPNAPHKTGQPVFNDYFKHHPLCKRRTA